MADATRAGTPHEGLRMSGMLASVCSVAEARIALHAYVDIIDCKNPRRGALGALPPNTIGDIADAVGGARTTSATTGDDLRSPKALLDAIRLTADCGVDYVKFGLFEAEVTDDYIKAIETIAPYRDLIAVCFIDRYDPTALLERLAGSGIRGVMIDTADKTTPSLTELWSTDQIAGFVQQAQALGLLCGLAGRLRLVDIPILLPMQADYLGFRSALCRGARRQQQLDHTAVMQVRETIPFKPRSAIVERQRASLHR